MSRPEIYGTQGGQFRNHAAFLFKKRHNNQSTKPLRTSKHDELRRVHIENIISIHKTPYSDADQTRLL